MNEKDLRRKMDASLRELRIVYGCPVFLHVSHPLVGGHVAGDIKIEDMIRLYREFKTIVEKFQNAGQIMHLFGSPNKSIVLGKEHNNHA